MPDNTMKGVGLAAQERREKKTCPGTTTEKLGI
jgi:hypothetical protein